MKSKANLTSIAVDLENPYSTLKIGDDKGALTDAKEQRGRNHYNSVAKLSARHLTLSMTRTNSVNPHRR